MQRVPLHKAHIMRALEKVQAGAKVRTLSGSDVGHWLKMTRKAIRTQKLCHEKGIEGVHIESRACGGFVPNSYRGLAEATWLHLQFIPGGGYEVRVTRAGGCNCSFGKGEPFLVVLRKKGATKEERKSLKLGRGTNFRRFE